MPRYTHIRPLVLLAAMAALALPSSALGAGDDYPAEYRNADPINDSTRWGYAPRGTPSFIAWRLEQHGIRVSANNGWGLFIQSGLTVPVMQEMLAPGLGARIDQTPAPEAIALWPGAMAGWNVTEWVAAVNPDGSTVTESYFTNTGYMSRTLSGADRAPWYVHLPAGGRVPPRVGDPGSGTGTRPKHARVGRITVKGRVLLAKLNLTRAGAVRFTLRRGARTVDVSRRVAAGPRTVRVKLPRKPNAGRNRLIVRAPGDNAAARVRVSRVIRIA